jgi:uncharacterized membrane protein YfcA
MGLSAPELSLLALVVALAFFVESATGFGSMVVALTLGALRFPVTSLLGWLLPVNLVLSTYLVARGWRSLDGPFLGRRALPLVLGGLLVGLAVSRVVQVSRLEPLFAGLVVVVAAALVRGALQREVPVPLHGPVRAAALLGAGVVHGLFATGGPLAVFVFSRELKDKAAFRATLSALWLVLNLLLLPRLVGEGVLSAGTLSVSALLLAPLAVGIVAGERLHARLDEGRFRQVVGVLLVAAGGVLLTTSLLKARGTPQ